MRLTERMGSEMPETGIQDIAEMIQTQGPPVKGEISVDDYEAGSQPPVEEKQAAEPEPQPEPEEPQEPPKQKIRVQIPDEDGGFHEKEYEPEELGKRHANATARIRELQRQLEEVQRAWMEQRPVDYSQHQAEPPQTGPVSREQFNAWVKSYEEQGYDADQARQFAQYWANEKAQEYQRQQAQEQSLQSIRQEVEQFKAERLLAQVVQECQRERPDFAPFDGPNFKPEYQAIWEEYDRSINLKQLFKIWNLKHPKSDPRASEAAKSRVAPTVGGGGIRKPSVGVVDEDAMKMARVFFPEEHEKADREQYLKMVAAQRKGSR